MGSLNTSNMFSIPVPEYRLYHLEGCGAKGCMKAAIQGIVRNLGSVLGLLF